MATAFDTLAISRSIRDAGVDERAAEAITHAIAAAISREREDLASKTDVLSIRSEMALIEQRLGKQISESQTKTGEMVNRLLLALGSMILTTAGLIVAAIKLL